MSLRVLACSLAVLGFSAYAWRNWFVSLCAVPLLMAFLEHPDMPKSIGDIQGLNLWNVLMLNVLLAWWRDRRHRGEVWDMPRHVTVLAAMYLFVIIWSFSRLLGDYGALQTINEHHADHLRPSFTLTWITSEYLINCVKWVIPGILFYDACRTRRRVVVGLIFVFSLYFLLAVQVIKHMPLSAVTVSGRELSRLAAHILDRSIGFFRTELSMMFAGASWAVLCMLGVAKRRLHQLTLFAVAAAIALAQAETGGRMGYVTWGLTGLFLCLVRWRRLLPVIPLTIAGVCIFLPSVRDRMLMGFGHTKGSIVVEQNDAVITSGRTIAWSYVIPKIWESPVFGYGRQAMIRTGIYEQIMADYDSGETFPHPHNAFLELLLDNGIVGFLLVMPFYLVILAMSVRLLVDRSDPLFSAAGGCACALILGLMIASMASQSFYPKESSLGMWCSIGIMLRVYLARLQMRTSGLDLAPEAPDEVELGFSRAQPGEVMAAAQARK